MLGVISIARDSVVRMMMMMMVVFRAAVAVSVLRMRRVLNRRSRRLVMKRAKERIPLM